MSTCYQEMLQVTNTNADTGLLSYVDRGDNIHVLAIDRNSFTHRQLGTITATEMKVLEHTKQSHLV